MANSTIRKIMDHPERETIVNKMVLNVPEKDINKWLKDKYEAIDSSLVISVAGLKSFKADYLDMYSAISKDVTQLRTKENLQNVEQEVTTMVQSNSVYRKKLEEYLDQEIDIKKIAKNLVVAIEFRTAQVFDKIQEKGGDITKSDYLLIQYLNTLTTVLDRVDKILNDSPDKIAQQNNFNIQILDQHVSTFYKAIRNVIADMDYEASLKFIDRFEEEIRKIRPSAADEPTSVDFRLGEAHKIQEATNQLDIPSF